MKFEPIAIVGQSCVLPGAFSPDELWKIVLNGHNCITPAKNNELLGDIYNKSDSPGHDGRDPQASSRHRLGGFVRGFNTLFDPTTYQIDSELVTQLAPLFQWVLYAGKVAYQQPRSQPKRTGAVIGNLSYPTLAFCQVAQKIWFNSFDLKQVHPLNRFMSGYPAALLAKALNLSGPAYCIDAACASSLYAIKLACDELQRGRVEMMLAGGVNATDELLLNVGFTELGAISPSGQSRPFHREADGLIPASGAVFVALKRLEDAKTEGDEILAVIRGIGLSNDGNTGALLSPSVEAQIRAMRRAYRSAELSPASVSLIECHATGTPVGDRVEINSLSELYNGCKDIPIGSLKSNFGHLVTAAGLAGVLKVIAAIKNNIRPPTLNAELPIPEIENSPFRVLYNAEPWTVAGPKRAALSTFGFGGNNAHMILEQHDPKATFHFTAPGALVDVAIVGIGTHFANLKDTDAVAKAWLSSTSQLKKNGNSIEEAITDTIEINHLQSGSPPNDLNEIHPQQLMVLSTVNEAIQSVSKLDCDRTSVFIGMAANIDFARYLTRLQTSQILGISDPHWQQSVKKAIIPALNSVRVLGGMANVTANRINAQHDFKGPSFSFSAEELSGIEALRAARHALSSNEIDAAIVGAVDLCCNPVHSIVGKMCLPDKKQSPGDGAVSLVIKRLDDAKSADDTIYAVITRDKVSADLTVKDTDVSPIFGHVHAASGLMQVALGALTIHYNAQPGKGSPTPIIGGYNCTVRVPVESFTGLRQSVYLRAGDTHRIKPFLSKPVPHLYRYTGTDRRNLLNNLKNNHPSAQGDAKLAIIADTPQEFEFKKHQVIGLLSTNIHYDSYMLIPGVYFCERPLHGELALTFPASAGAYSRMGQALLLAFPEILKSIKQRFGDSKSAYDAAAWIYQTESDETSIPLFSKLNGNLFLSIVHTFISQELLKIKADAYIGFSAGETAALFASGVWQDIHQYYDEIIEQAIWTHELGNDLAILNVAWKDYPEIDKSWVNWSVRTSYERIVRALAKEPLVHLATINTKDNFTICGQADACRRVVAEIGANNCQPMNYNLIHHCPEMDFFKDPWLALNTRRLHRHDIRFYGSTKNIAYSPKDERTVSKALLDTAMHTVDFPKIINRAYNDGIRIFVEQGARSSCTSFIDQILGDQPHLAISFDRFGRNSVQTLLEAVAKLYVIGVELECSSIDLAAKESPIRIKGSDVKQPELMAFPAHAKEIILPKVDEFVDDDKPLNNQNNRLSQLTMPKTSSSHDIAPFDSSVWNPSEMPSTKASKQIKTTAKGGSESIPSAESFCYMTQIAALHQAFIKQQATLHQRYLEINQNITSSMSAALNCTDPPQQYLPMSHQSEGRTADPKIVFNEPEDAPVDAQNHMSTKHAPIPETIPTIPKTLSQMRTQPVGPTFDRAQLNIHASGNISDIFGDLFKSQDQYDIQVRMPGGPMLLADRVTGMDAQPGSLGLGTVWTETDIHPDAWYLHQGHIPPGVMIEGGQADLFLISYLGIDSKNKGKRAYRLLGCDVTFLDELPRVGDTLQYEIQIDRHAMEGNIHLFFFHTDCYIGDRHILSGTNGCAGFFSQQELLESKGVIWTPEKADIELTPRLDAPLEQCTYSRFSRSQLDAFAAGRLSDCFGKNFRIADTHTRTPTIPPGEQLLIEEITDFKIGGGPWQRGYLKAVRNISADDWFFKSHFKNDPCMPGTLMMDMAFQSIAFFIAALGYTLNKDGWTFAPVPHHKYKLQCRGQIVPQSQEISFEVFIREIISDPEPTIFADILGSVDGLKAIYGERLGVRLMPDFPNPYAAP